MINLDEKFMELAIELAKKGEGKVNPNPMVGAVIVKDGIVIGEGYHEKYGEGHAEVNAFKSLKEDPSGATMYVTLEPCPMCAGALGWSQIPRIVYGAADDKRGLHVYAPKALHPRTTISGGILEEECRQLMQDFFRSRR